MTKTRNRFLVIYAVALFLPLLSFLASTTGAPPLIVDDVIGAGGVSLTQTAARATMAGVVASQAVESVTSASNALAEAVSSTGTLLRLELVEVASTANVALVTGAVAFSSAVLTSNMVVSTSNTLDAAIASTGSVLLVAVQEAAATANMALATGAVAFSRAVFASNMVVATSNALSGVIASTGSVLRTSIVGTLWTAAAARAAADSAFNLAQSATGMVGNLARHVETNYWMSGRDLIGVMTNRLTSLAAGRGEDYIGGADWEVGEEETDWGWWTPDNGFVWTSYWAPRACWFDWWNYVSAASYKGSGGHRNRDTVIRVSDSCVISLAPISADDMVAFVESFSGPVIRRSLVMDSRSFSVGGGLYLYVSRIDSIPPNIRRVRLPGKRFRYSPGDGVCVLAINQDRKVGIFDVVGNFGDIRETSRDTELKIQLRHGDFSVPVFALPDDDGQPVALWLYRNSGGNVYKIWLGADVADKIEEKVRELEENPDFKVNRFENTGYIDADIVLRTIDNLWTAAQVAYSDSGALIPQVVVPGGTGFGWAVPASGTNVLNFPAPASVLSHARGLAVRTTWLRRWDQVSRDMYMYLYSLDPGRILYTYSDVTHPKTSYTYGGSWAVVMQTNIIEGGYIPTLEASRVRFAILPISGTFCNYLVRVEFKWLY